ncbi:hypothetical protein [Listeria valentina]|uniref:hypothetical protein n=1 Tax=Listeria valentina TaxID=2705293 RepID=UPI0014311F9F|nr:hypothetical protein [Listeria valentina]
MIQVGDTVKMLADDYTCIPKGAKVPVLKVFTSVIRVELPNKKRRWVMKEHVQKIKK